MRAKLGTIDKKIIVFLVLVLFHASCGAQSLNSLYARIEQSIVKVEAPDIGNTATGFVWKQADYVVTSLHVVDGSTNIQIYYPAQKVTRAATVLKVFQNADLVLLQVDDAPTVPPLTHTTQLPDADDEVHTLGFYLNTTGINSFTFKLRYGSRVLRDNISTQVIRSIQNNGYPSPDLEVLKLGEDSLLPGLSGAPIFNINGEVVGIGDGGLEEGAINISWAVPADNLDTLLTSSVATLPNSSGTRELFAGELDLDIGPTITSGGIQLVKVKTRSLVDLISSADDQLGLSQLSNYFAGFNPGAFLYDIYLDIDSGATVVLPAGVTLSPSSDGFWTVDLLSSSNFNFGNIGRLEAILQIKNTTPQLGAQQLSLQFEQAIIQVANFIWQPDYQWSYLAPYTRFDGLVVNRKAFAGLVNNGFQFMPQAYLFETLGTRNNVFIGLAIINYNNTPQLTNLWMSCAQGAVFPECQAAYQYSLAWAQLALGVQLTTFGL